MRRSGPKEFGPGRRFSFGLMSVGRTIWKMAANGTTICRYPTRRLSFQGLVVSMPSVAARAQEHQKRWSVIVADSALEDLPYKVETNARGQVVLSPHKNWHSDLQAALIDLLKQFAPEGHVPPGYALATPQGVKAPDVVWMSADRREEMRKTGDPSTLAPEICVEVMSESNTEEEMQERSDLYLEIGAEEVWVVDKEGEIRFFEKEERERSKIAPECPPTIQA